MPKLDYFEILKQGVTVWNEWRQQNPEVWPNLVSANLSNLDLSEINLSTTDLREANLSYCNLTGANLTGAILIWADLRNSNLRSANLYLANLNGAVLDEARLDESIMGETILTNNNLRNVYGLDSIVHYGRSRLGIDTIYLSEGQISHKFLMDAGVPGNFIQNMNSLSNELFSYHSCFISYSSKDQNFANRLYYDLQKNGVQCWFAPEDLKWGEKIRVGIDESIQRHDKLLLILSKHSVGSDWVEKEVETAMEKEYNQKRIILFPIRIDDTVMKIERGWPADIRRTRNIGDFRHWKKYDPYQEALNRLLRDLKAETVA